MSGDVIYSKASYDIPRENTSFILRDVNQSNYNIFHLKAITYGFNYSYISYWAGKINYNIIAERNIS